MSATLDTSPSRARVAAQYIALHAGSDTATTRSAILTNRHTRNRVYADAVRLHAGDRTKREVLHTCMNVVEGWSEERASN